MEWIKCGEKMPNKGDKVLIVRNVKKWDEKRPITIDIARVGFLEQETVIDGPISLTGYHKMKGLYFSVPAILHPESVTHWMPLPEPPKTETP